MAKATKASVETKLHDDGAVSHKVNFANGESRLVFIKAGHDLAQHFIAHGSKAKILAAINSVDDMPKAVSKVDELDKAFGEGKWSLQTGDGKSRAGSLVQALAALKGVSIEEADAYAKTLSRADQAKLRANPRVAAKIIEIEAEERSGSDAALDAFLGDVGGEEEKAA